MAREETSTRACKLRCLDSRFVKGLMKIINTYLHSARYRLAHTNAIDSNRATESQLHLYVLVTRSSEGFNAHAANQFMLPAIRFSFAQCKQMSPPIQQTDLKPLISHGEHCKQIRGYIGRAINN